MLWLIYPPNKALFQFVIITYCSDVIKTYFPSHIIRKYSVNFLKTNIFDFVNVMMCCLLIVLLLEAIADLDVLLNGMDGRLIRLLIITSRTLQSKIWVIFFKTSQGNSLRPLEKSSFQNRTHTGEKSYPKQHPQRRHKTLSEKINWKLISDDMNLEVKPCKCD